MPYRHHGGYRSQYGGFFQSPISLSQEEKASIAAKKAQAAERARSAAASFKSGLSALRSGVSSSVSSGLSALKSKGSQAKSAIEDYGLRREADKKQKERAHAAKLAAYEAEHGYSGGWKRPRRRTSHRHRKTKSKPKRKSKTKSKRKSRTKRRQSRH